jgi:Xaa-Pro aminopeptidase
MERPPRPATADRIQGALDDSDLQAIVAWGLESFQYFSGHWYLAARNYPYRKAMVIWPKGADPICLVGRDQAAGPRRYSWIADIRTYDALSRRPPGGIAEALAAVIRELRLDRGRIGIELLAAPYPLMRDLISELPHAEFVACDEFLDTLRSVKTPDELRTMRKVAAAAEEGIKRGLVDARRGWTERQLANAIHGHIMDLGASNVTLMLVSAGPRARGFFGPTDEVMPDGSFVRIDLNAILDGYYADVGRMAVVGTPSPEQEDLYARQLALNSAVVDFMKPGVTAESVFAHSSATAASLGVELMPQPLIGLGHTIGLNSNDLPALKPGELARLEPGMVLNIEPDIYGPEREVIHVEEMVEVTSSGAEIITGTEDWSVLPRIE